MTVISSYGSELVKKVTDLATKEKKKSRNLSEEEFKNRLKDSEKNVSENDVAHYLAGKGININRDPRNLEAHPIKAQKLAMQDKKQKGGK
jgi:hypothetical protein